MFPLFHVLLKASIGCFQKMVRKDWKQRIEITGIYYEVRDSIANPELMWQTDVSTFWRKTKTQEKYDEENSK